MREVKEAQVGCGVAQGKQVRGRGGMRGGLRGGMHGQVTAMHMRQRVSERTCKKSNDSSGITQTHIRAGAAFD